MSLSKNSISVPFFSAFCFEISSAFFEISTAVTSASLKKCFTETAIHPLPVHISKTLISAQSMPCISFIISTAFSTRVSVSCLGISTSFETLNSNPMKNALPVIYWHGSCAALRLINSRYLSCAPHSAVSFDLR